MRFNSFTNSSLIINTNAAPSLICDELPAVTLPSEAKTGFKFPNAAVLVSALGPSSLVTVYDLVSFFPFSLMNVCSTVIGTICLSNLPSACAFSAF